MTRPGRVARGDIECGLRSACPITLDGELKSPVNIAVARSQVNAAGRISFHVYPGPAFSGDISRVAIECDWYVL